MTQPNSTFQEFKNALAGYKQARDAYKLELNKHSDMLPKVLNSHKGVGDTDVIDQGDYVLTPDGVLMKKEGSAVSPNTISGDYYISDKTYSNNLNLSNVYVQHDLNDMYYDPSSNQDSIRHVTWNQSDIKIPAGGNMEQSVMKCDGYAKMMNKPYYGIDSCYNCFVYENEPIDTVTNDVDINISSIGSQDISKIAYLGVMFDGGLYALKDPLYKNNFIDLYDPSSTNIIPLTSQSTVVSDSNVMSDCNMFVGSGVNRVTFHDFGLDVCEYNNT